MGVSGQCHALAAILPRGKDPPVPIIQEAGWPQSRSGHKGFTTVRTSNVVIWLNLNNVNQLIFVMVKCGVLFEVRTEFLNII
jgi:hypothetical protein